MKQKVKAALWWFIVGFCIGITPYTFYVADLQRGYYTIGGEMFIPLIPFLAWALKNSIKK